MPMKNKKGGSLNISASAIETFDRCQRKWYFGYVERIRGPKNAAADRGDKIHDLAERYLKGQVTARGIETLAELLTDPPDTEDTTGWEGFKALLGLLVAGHGSDTGNYKVTDPVYWRQLVPGLQFAPTPEQVIADGWGVEDWVKEACGPLNFVGKVDIYHRESFTISDWKTTGNKKWEYSKTPTQLRNHVQPRVYAYALFKHDPPDVVRFQHINMQSKGRAAAMEVWAEDVPWQEIEDTWNSVLETSKAMAQVATENEDMTTVAFNPKACYDFGRCEHAAICPASPQNRTAILRDQAYTGPAPMTTQNSDVEAKRLALLKKMGIDVPSTTPAITPTPKAVAAPTPAAGIGRAGVAQLQTVLDATGKVPQVVAGMLVSDPEELAAAISYLGLVLTDGSYVVGTPTPPISENVTPAAPPWKAGTLIKKHWENTGTTGVPEGAKVVAGMLVAVDWEGGAVDAIRQYSLDPDAIAAADALDAVSTPAADPEPEAGPGQSGTPADLDTRKAAKVIIEALKDGDDIDKGQAGDRVKKVTSWKRIGNKRWGEVAEAANDWLATQGASWTVVFDKDEGFRQVTAASITDGNEGVISPTAAPAPEGTASNALRPIDEVEAEIAADAAKREAFPFGPTRTSKVFNDDKVLAAAQTAVDGEAARLVYLAAWEDNGRLPDEVYTEGYEQAKEIFNSRGPNSATTIYIDCAPTEGYAADFAIWIAQFTDAVEAKNGVNHYALLPYTDGKDKTVATVKAKLHREGPAALPEDMVVNSRHPLAQDIIPLIQRLEGAVNIIQAVR